MFYSALHWVRALAHEKNIDIGDTHPEVLKNINPNKYGKMPVKRHVYQSYRDLREYSNKSRYEGFMSFEAFQQLNKSNHNMALQNFKEVKDYCKKEGNF